MTRRLPACAVAAAIAALPAVATHAPAQTSFHETEPNSTRATAQPVGPMAPGDSITGVTAGTALADDGPASADYFLITVATAPLGIYRHRLVVTADPPGHIGNLRGVPQNPAPAGPWPGPVGEALAADAILQATSLTTDPQRYLQWYGFGRGERIVFRITGTAVTSTPYTATLQTTPVEPLHIGPFASGDITFSTIGRGHATDTDLWIYDASLRPIRGYGNDDESVHGGGTGSTTQSLLTRRFTPGVYYLALSVSNLANHRTSPSDDDMRTMPVHEYPDVASSASTVAGSDCSFTVTDSAGVTAVAAIRPEAYDILWYRFEVVGGETIDCNANGMDDFFETIEDPALDCWSAAAPAGVTGGPDGALDACQCTGNFTRDAAVNSADISAFLSAWLLSVQAPNANADIDCSGSANSADISAFLNRWLANVQGADPSDGCP